MAVARAGGFAATKDAADSATVSPDDIAARHQPVMLTETLAYLAPERGGLFLDGTLGLGGHTAALLDAAPNVRVIGLDQDRVALDLATQRLAHYGARFQAVHGNFGDLANLAQVHGWPEFNGVLVDLGVSSVQFDTPERGFSFRYDAPLDMRMDGSDEVATAADLLAQSDETELARIIYEYGEERHSRRIARRIVERREAGRPVTTTLELADLVARSMRPARHQEIHPATRTFQALRIAVNRELAQLENFLPVALERLARDGRLVVISFHSLEDRIVKRTLRRWSGQCECPPRQPFCNCGARAWVEILTRRPVTPDAAESAANPRARSAKLRACRRSSPDAPETSVNYE